MSLFRKNPGFLQLVFVLATCQIFRFVIVFGINPVALWLGIKEVWNVQYPVSFKMSTVERSCIKSVANFAVRFCNEMDSNKNFFCSPLSVETVLAITALSSGKHSRKEIFKALYIPNENDLRSSFKFLKTTLDLQSSSVLSTTETDRQNVPTEELIQKRDLILKTANKIYLREPIKPDIKKEAVEIFNASLEEIDFTQRTAAADIINNWVSNQTNNLIKQVVSEEMFDAKTKLIIVNAIYFHGFWKYPFLSNYTTMGVFHVNSSKDVHIKMMEKKEAFFNFKHNPELKAKILQMFYKGDEASMVIVLPDEIDGLSGVMQRITDGCDLMEEIKSLNETRLKVVIPKFKVETEINLIEVLLKMGIKTIFLEEDIYMLSSNEPVAVTNAIQKAFIAVDEKGTEAAAVTVFRGKRLCKRQRMFWDNEFIADHPFLFTVTACNIPIFYGVFRDIETSQ